MHNQYGNLDQQCVQFMNQGEQQNKVNMCYMNFLPLVGAANS